MISRVFGTLPSGEKVSEITLKQKTGFQVKILTYGGIISEISAMSKAGYRENCVLSYASLDDYLENPAYIGAIIGRTAGRIAKASFQLDHTEIKLDTTVSNTALHGGVFGLHQVNWKVKECGINHLLLYYEDPEACGKPPGTVNFEALFDISEPETLKLNMKATSNQKTYINLTHHTYFNLSGEIDSDIVTHRMKLKSDTYAEINEENIPKSGLQYVDYSPFDFRKWRTIGNSLLSVHPQIKRSGGLDHPFKLSESQAAIKLYEPKSQRLLVIDTNQAFVVIYSGNYLNEAKVRSDKGFPKYGGICFEAQAIPNEPNREGANEIFLEPGQVYTHKTTYNFSVLKHSIS